MVINKALLIRLFEVFFQRKSFDFQSFVGFKSSVEFNCLIFEKLLKVSPSGMRDKAKSGQVTNFMQIDSMKLTMMMLSSPDLVTIPILIVAYSYMLYMYMGLASFFGVLCLLFFITWLAASNIVLVDL